MGYPGLAVRLPVIVTVAVALAGVFIPCQQAHADRIKAAREAARLVIKRFGGKAVGESAEQLAPRIASAAARHGDDAIVAVQRIGPKAIRYADDAGAHGPQVMRLIARHGDDAVIVSGNPQALALVGRHGDDAAEALIRSKGAGLPLISKHGDHAVRALKGLDPQSARRLTMLENGGDLARIGRTDELLGVVGRYGQPAMDFIWNNKGALAVGSALAAFLANPEPFIEGTAGLAGTVTESMASHVAEPLITATIPAVQETVIWGLRSVVALAIAAGLGLAFLLVGGLYKPICAWLRQALPPATLPPSKPPEAGQQQP